MLIKIQRGRSCVKSLLRECLYYRLYLQRQLLLDVDAVQVIRVAAEKAADLVFLERKNEMRTIFSALIAGIMFLTWTQASFAARWDTNCDDKCTKHVAFGIKTLDPVCKSACEIEKGFARNLWNPPAGIRIKDCEFNTSGVAVQCR